jgi:hypothetical protein
MSRLQNPVIRDDSQCNTMSCDEDAGMRDVILTFLVFPSSASDKATTSPEHNFEAFKIIACTTTRLIARTPDSMAAGGLRRTVNLGIDIDAVVITTLWS